MVKLIAAIDDKRGIANDHGIPWEGKLPSDVEYYHGKIKGGSALIGHVMYTEMKEPLPNVRNFVLTQSDEELKPGFERVKDLNEFLQNPPENLWSVGGARTFEETIGKADELYLTRVEGDFGCTKFFPTFETEFESIYESPPMTENGITFRFEVWSRIKKS